jgi:hypothetical protein
MRCMRQALRSRRCCCCCLHVFCIKRRIRNLLHGCLHQLSNSLCVAPLGHQASNSLCVTLVMHQALNSSLLHFGCIGRPVDRSHGHCYAITNITVIASATKTSIAGATTIQQYSHCPSEEQSLLQVHLDSTNKVNWLLYRFANMSTTRPIYTQ